MKRFVFAVLTGVLLSTSTAAALSPAMEIISKKVEMRKCVASSYVLCFEKEDFDRVLGGEVESVTIVTLPPEESGVLTLKGSYVRQGQTLDKSMLDSLRFNSGSSYLGTAQFEIESGGNTAVCSISVLEGTNYAPEAGEQWVSTGKNISLYERFGAADPENDDVTFEIVKYPTHGSVEIMKDDGVFVYRPKNGFVGNDSFSYEAMDEFGNRSQKGKVNIKVSRPAADIYFDDMKEHPAHNSAVKMAATGLMRGEYDENGLLCFNPDLDMTRGDFLALALIMAGHENDIPFASKTSFADDSMIPQNIKSYAEYAFDKGIVSGYENLDGSVNFESSAKVTRAEGAVIISRILELDTEAGAVPAYKDVESVPVWAGDAVFCLAQTGILDGLDGDAFNAERAITRAEGADIICNVAEYLEDKQNKEKPKKSIFNLFGLLG